MGVLTDVVKSIDTSGEQKKDIKETLDLLVELTQAKTTEIKNSLEDNLINGRILGKSESAKSLFYPISSVKDSKVEYRCLTKDKPTDLISEIGKSIASMIDNKSADNIVKGISTIINESLRPLLGLNAGTEQYASSTSTFIEGTGVAVSIVRFDTIVWGRSIIAESIKKKIDTTLCCVAYKSVVDVAKISFDDFRAVYAPILEASSIKDPIEAIKKAKEIFELLGGGSKLTNTATKAIKELTINDLVSNYTKK